MPMDDAIQRHRGQEGSGEEYTPEPSYIIVGRIRRPHGLWGELRVEIITDYPERLQQHTCFYLAPPNAPEAVQRYPVEGSRLHKDLMLLKLGGCDDRDKAEELRGMLVQVLIEDAVPLEEGEYYHFQLVGVKVETETGEWLGQVTEVLDTGAHDVYVVRGPCGEVLLPAVEDVVLELDLEAGEMVVHLLPGMLGENQR
jgi:16S rRNA processing protein RimM